MTSLEALVTQLVSLTDFALLLCPLTSNNVSRKGWLASKASSLSSNSINVASACLLLLSSSSSASINACSFFIPLEVKFFLLLGQTQYTFVQSLILFASIFCNEKFSLLLPGCLGNSRSRGFGSLRRILGFWSGFKGRLRSFSRLRKAIGVPTSFFFKTLLFSTVMSFSQLSNHISVHRGL